MDNQKYINELKLTEALTKSLNTVLEKEKIIKSIVKKTIHKTVAFFLIKNKLIIYLYENKEPLIEIITFDEIKKIKMVNVGKKKVNLIIEYENDTSYTIDTIDWLSANEFIKEFNKALINDINSIKEANKTEFLSNDYDDGYLLNQIKSKEAPDNNLTKKEPKQEKLSNLNNFTTASNSKNEINKNEFKPQKRVIDDNNISNDTTFSSLYLTNLLTKKISELPDGSILYSQIIDRKINNLITEQKLFLSNNDMDIKEIITTIAKFRRIVENFDVSYFNDKLQILKLEIIKEVNDSSNFKIDKKNLDKINDKVFELKLEIDKKINSIISTFENKFLKIPNKDYFDSHLTKTSTEIDKINFYFKSSIKEILNKIETINEKVENSFSQIDQIKSLSNDLVKSDNVYSYEKMFLSQNFSVKNKLFAVGSNGVGSFFDIGLFKKDLIDYFKNSIDSFSENINKIINRIISEIDDLKNNKLLTNPHSRINSDKKSGIFNFIARPYKYNGITRYGLRSGQIITLYKTNNRIGLEDLYINEETSENLNILEYDGIFFCNKKYYFNNVSEFDLNKKFNLKINHIDYYEGIFPYRMYEININDNFIEYKVYNEKGILLNDSIFNSEKYDLKWLILFKD